MAEYKNKIEQMDIEELNDLVQELNEEIQRNVSQGRKNFNRAMEADKRKEKVLARLSELKDFPTQQQQNKSSVQNAFGS